MIRSILCTLFSFIYLFSFAQENEKTAPVILSGCNNDLNTIVASPSKYKRMATAGWNNEVLIYQTDTPNKLVQKLTGHSAPINTIAYSFSGNMFASGASDNTILVYDSLYRVIPISEDLNKRHLSSVNALVFDRTGKYIFSGDKDGKLMLWDLINKRPIKFYLTGNTINDICLANNAANLFVAHSHKQIKLIALASGKIVRTLDGHTDIVNVLAISANNQFLISGSNDKTARIWDLKTWKQVQVLQVESWKVTAVAFTDDSKYCATGANDGVIKVWEVKTGKLISQQSFPELSIKDIAFSKNYLQIYIAPKLKEGGDFGARIIPSLIPDLIKAPVVSAEANSDQTEIDSIMAERPLTKADSIKYRSVLMPKAAKTLKAPIKGKKAPTQNPKIEAPVIYKTPMKK
ncbi:MAG: WD40 repeat domain-containing protein [bacterium]|nr:WD40 repeat domain-containing protein [bacterium]